MPRKGGGKRGFMKGARRAAAPGSDGSGDDGAAAEPALADDGPTPDAVEQPQLTGYEVHAPAAAPDPARAGASGRAEAGESSSSEDAGDGGAEPGETRGRMLQRHKREAKELKDAAKRAGKKAKEDFKQREADMQQRHARELAAADAVAPSAENGAGDEEAPVAQEESAAGRTGGGGKRSKGQKRRERLEQQEAQRDTELAEAVANMGTTARVAEEGALREVLLPLGLQVVDIPADGNCMYRALAHQCETKGAQALIDGLSPLQAHSALREKAAAHIERHRAAFEPFVVNVDAPEGAEAQLAAFCAGVRGVEWGTQVELQALAAELRVYIEVFSARYPLVKLGEEFAGPSAPVLQVCYLQHAYGSGEHYNSVGPAQVASDA